MAVIAVIVFMMFSSLTGKYNQIVTLDESMDTAWAQVENVLQRRADLIPNLVSTVKGYATHEKDVFTQVAKARSRVGSANSRSDSMTANNQLSQALGRLLLVVERYPDLKANQNFIRLQDELSGTENRISVERRRYNSTVQAYNSFVRRFPNSFIGSLFGYTKDNRYFKADEAAKSVPKVDFGK